MYIPGHQQAMNQTIFIHHNTIQNIHGGAGGNSAIYYAWYPLFICLYSFYNQLTILLPSTLFGCFIEAISFSLY